MAAQAFREVKKEIEVSYQEWRALDEKDFRAMIDNLKRYAVDFLKEHPDLELCGTSPLGTDIGYNMFDEKFYIRFFVREKVSQE